MKKKSIFMVIMALTLLTACSRERITIKYAEPTEAMTIESEERKYENKSEDISSKLRFMKNPFRELESEQDNTIYKVYFSDKDLAENRKKVWDKICSLPEVERVKRSIYYPANLKIKLENIHPDYYQRAIENGYDENLLKQRGYLDIRLYVYTSPDIEKNTLSMFRMAKEYSDGWDTEEWPFYIEENDDVEINYANDLDTSLPSTVNIEHITEHVPWYLNYSWSNEEAMLLLREDAYNEIFGEDFLGRNISGLSGFEWYFVESKEGCQKELEKKMLELGADTVSREGYLVGEE